MAHIAGLVAADIHPSPLPHAHVVTTTTHKTLRGPRGGMVLSNDEEIGKKINSAIFPGIQGGPLMHVIAAKAVAFGEALSDDFKDYAKQVVANAKALATSLEKQGVEIISGGTDTHLALVDLRPKGLTGKLVEEALEGAGITCNKNGIPFDDEKPTITSGIRVGTSAGTTRGFKEGEFTEIGVWIGEILNDILANKGEVSAGKQKEVRAKVEKLCADFPLYTYL
ncbi:MAG: serine hydroxymethyltransferase, partial [Parvibaculales bacterium]